MDLPSAVAGAVLGSVATLAMLAAVIGAATWIDRRRL